ncbi:6-phosphofructokinase [Thomasclavelia cocleata]|uniref:Pyrophosphate--fructose 6-phosphate 1-phosphotransferase n=1 Tax=Thomasclavelia cocleata TaxID=69824 RepID=A0A1I0CL24_9FIRM|nr:6-phosphofructokinase [Thomasclavelia cocleata]MCR1959465.1 6-phosphofructokinase [Thomasclavelia cocleata]NDO42487.1 6-phosphofructokinase [Thomasclavelia cocleata]GFI40564.1 pyrophosphate--fructose 6-phosphate 1-phosphotransferase [Thomasclavelia cocleata]SET20374.1 6-phosphofructokinase [Thomasclavelia cocleata]
MKKRNCIIGQSGGPTIAINASLAGIIHKAKYSEEYQNVYGMINGIKGLLEERYMNLLEEFNTGEKINALKQTPAMYLGSCRFKLPTHEENTDTYVKLFEILTKLEITDFYYIGGNDSMDTVMKLDSYAKSIGSTIKFIGIPKTIDNDLMGTDHTPGFGSAAKYVASSILEVIHDSLIYQLQSVTIIEIMGRNAGWLTAAAALARNEYNEAPDLIYLPEVVFDINNFLDDIREVFKRKRCVVIAVSEGIKDKNGHFLDDNSKYLKKDAFGHVLHSGTGKMLETIVFKEFQCKVRSIELNVLQRCAMHIGSKTDLNESFVIGQKAVETAIAGKTGQVMGFKRISNNPYSVDYISTDVQDVANLEQKIPTEWINEAGNNITQELYDYLFPLIQGEVHINYRNGIPAYYSCKHLNK